MATEKQAPLTKHRGRWICRPRLSPTYRPQVDVGPATMSPARAAETYAAMCEQGLLSKMLAQHEAKGAPGEPPKPQGVTVRQLGQDWTSGRLLATYKAVEGLADNPKWMATVAQRLEKHAYPEIGDMLVADVTPEDIDRVLRRAEGLAPSTVNAYRSHLSMLFHFARKLVKLRKDNPVDDAVEATAEKEEKDFTWLYPAELISLVTCADVPMTRRVAYALAVYTGLRKGSLLSLTWGSLDVTNGTLTVRKTKTGAQLFFAVEQALMDVLVAWRARKGNPADDVPILNGRKLGWFARTGAALDSAASLLRADLRTAGCTRARLYEQSDTVEPIRFHDLRATFITWARRDGRDSYWITSRSGHCDEKMIARYTRAASVLSELNIGVFPSLAPLVEAMANGRSLDAAEGAAAAKLPQLAAIVRQNVAAPAGWGGKMIHLQGG